MIQLVAGRDRLHLGRYGVFEIQTMDFHGTYARAVHNLRENLRMYGEEFAGEIERHQHWLGEKVEGPNIANVFKRTFYQMMFKFQVAAHAQSAGCVFAIPEAVWDSWQRHLGRPELVPLGDGTYAMASPEGLESDANPSWIYVFDLEISPTVSPNRLKLRKAIRTTAPILSHYALDVAPAAALEEGGAADAVMLSIQKRLGKYLKEFNPPARRRQRQRPAQDDLFQA